MIRTEVNLEVLAEGASGLTRVCPGRQWAGEGAFQDAARALERLWLEGLRSGWNLGRPWLLARHTGLIAKLLIYGSAGAIRENNISPCQR